MGVGRRGQRSATRARGIVCALLVGSSGVALGCAGPGPLLHPAHVNSPGLVSFGAGVAGRAVLRGVGSGPRDAAGEALQRITAAPGVAPWVSGRIGFAGSNEAGLAYTGRAVRADARHAFVFGQAALSVGLGGSLIIAQTPERDQDAATVYGGGADLPLLIGYRSRGDVYSVWVGPRFGFELLRGTLRDPVPPGPGVSPEVREASAHHIYGGLVLGLRAGFRHVHVALELGGNFHRAEGGLQGAERTLDLWSLTPGGALIFSY